MNLLRFALALIRAVYHATREAYYALALRHVGHNHPDSWLITHRMLTSRSKVNDFFSRVTR